MTPKKKRSKKPAAKSGAPTSPNAPDLILIGCGKSKVTSSDPVPARDLYTGQLFKARLAAAVASGKPWKIVSAKFGVIEPDDPLLPYDVTVSNLTPSQRRDWVLGVRSRVANIFGGRAEMIGKTVEVHAGKDYVELIGEALVGVNVVSAMAGKGIGEQLHDYKADAAASVDAAAIAKNIVAAIAPDAGSNLTAKEERKLAKERAEKARAATLKNNGGKAALELYFERVGRRFLIREGDRFEDKGDRLTKLALIRHGLSDYPDGSGMSEADAFLEEVSRTKKIDYYGPLPGYRAGLHQLGQQSFLVSEQCDAAVFDEPTPTKPTEEPPFIAAVLKEALSEFDQWIHFCHWLAVALRTLRRGDFKPGQFCWFVGKANSGKSLIQFIVTVILGGRGVNCAAQFGVSGDPNVEKFTTGLLKGEHWYMGDPVAGVMKGARLLMAGRMKTFFHEESFVFRGMQKVGFDVPVFRRGTGSVNDDPSDLIVLPDMRGGLGDKQNLYRFIDKGESSEGVQIPLDCVQQFVAQQSLPGFDSKDGADRKAIRAKVESEAAMARAWLLSQFRAVPADMADDRVGLKAWHHPQLIAELGAISPDARALSFIQKILFDVKKGDASASHWTHGPVSAEHIDINARELEQHLAQSNFSEELRNALAGIGHGHTLGRLAKSHKDAVQKIPPSNGAPRLWRLFNPFLTKQTNQTTE